MTDPRDVVSALGVYAGSFMVGALSSIVPFIIIDVFLIGLALHLGATPALVPIVMLAACGQLAGKLPMFYAARGATTLATRRSEKARARIERVQAWVTRWSKHPHLLLGASALFGIPPFSLLATAAGCLAIRVRAFCAIVISCRAVRFGVVVAITVATQR